MPKSITTMKKYQKYFRILLAGFFVFIACETTELDLTENPNELNPSQADATFFLNSIQLEFAYWVHYTGHRGGELVRINYMNGRNYNQVYDPDDWDYNWRKAFQGMMEDIRLMNVLADESGLHFHKGMGRVIKAYVLLTLVDYFGDIPYSETLQGAEGILNPKIDSGESIYQAAITLLDQSIQDFNTESAAPSLDFYYNGNAQNWIKAANSIKKKALLNLGDYGGYNAITDYIKNASEDFQFQWGTNEVTPDTRHPYYGGERSRSNQYNMNDASYTSTGGNEYMSNWLMSKMLNGYAGLKDPRMVYYFYRQVEATPGFGADPDEETLECSLPGYLNPYPAGVTFCGLPDGYWGRDHGNDNGIPPDGFLRTLRGMYPAGGTFDDRTFTGQVNGDGNGGNGITPIILSSWMHFMNAEVAWRSGNDPYDETLEGLTDSLNKTDDIGGPELSQENIDGYVTAFKSTWDSTNSTEAKMDLWATEYFISLTGNGIDGYNSYRRNGFPSDLQPNIEPNPGSFPLSQYYPANLTSSNSNVSQKGDLSQRVFWNVGGASNLK